MSTATATARNKMLSHPWWRKGRLAVHIAGADAGVMRLDMDLPDFETADDVRQHVKVRIPGEMSPLNAIGAIKKNGRFVVSYFSADIRNAGHLPAEAVVCWDADGAADQYKPVDIVAAERVRHTEGCETGDVPDDAPSVAYPRTVGLMSSISLVFLALCAMAFLNW